MRGTQLEHAKIHDWMINLVIEYKIMEPDTVCYAWKLAQPRWLWYISSKDKILSVKLN